MRTYARIVRVSVARGGGFGGLVRTTTADMESLSPSDRQEMLALVRQARLFDDPTPPDTGAPEPDRFTYTVTVEDEGHRREARFSERSLPEEVQNLISWVSTVNGHEESIEPPGCEKP